MMRIRNSLFFYYINGFTYFFLVQSNPFIQTSLGWIFVCANIWILRWFSCLIILMIDACIIFWRIINSGLWFWYKFYFLMNSFLYIIIYNLIFLLFTFLVLIACDIISFYDYWSIFWLFYRWFNDYGLSIYIKALLF